MSPSNCPVRQGIPAEWEHQSALQLTWPHDADAWGEVVLTALENVYTGLVELIAPTQTVIIVCHNQTVVRRLRERLRHVHGEIRFLQAPSNDIWCRDYGPISCYREGDIEFLNFRFNGWGQKYPHDDDNAITSRLKEQGVFNSAVVDIDYVLEGGGIDSNGEGTLLATTHCLQHPTRNPKYPPDVIAAKLIEYTGSSQVHWLTQGYLSGDDTDSHIDNLARFIDADTIAYSITEDPKDEHYPALQAMQVELESLRTANGQAYRLVPLPLPAPIHHASGRRLPASYANFLICNDFLLVPQFDDSYDATVVDTLSRYFPGRKTVGIDCRPLIQQYGGIHCACMPLFGEINL